MSTYAGEIAARLQGAHERRRNEREDEDMSESEAAKVARRLQKDGALDSWEPMAALFDQIRDRCLTVIRERDELKALADKTALAAADRTLQAEHSGELGRVQELERQLAVSDETIRSLTDLCEGARAELAEVSAQRDAARSEMEKLYHERSSYYVAREVPWSDVAAGMMTIARDGTPWMVADVATDGVVLRNAGQVFTKRPKPGETVRVLVPYVTPEAAEDLVRGQLGGTEVEA